MLCPHCKLGSYLGTCVCSVSDGVCPFVRRCNFERKWLPLESMNRCKLRIKQERVKAMGIHGYVVRFESKGKLYVEYNDRVIKIANPFDYTPDAVELVQVENELYIKGFEPKIEKVQEEKIEEPATDISEEKTIIDVDLVTKEQPKKKGGSKKKKDK